MVTTCFSGATGLLSSGDAGGGSVGLLMVFLPGLFAATFGVGFILGTTGPFGDGVPVWNLVFTDLAPRADFDGLLAFRPVLVTALLAALLAVVATPFVEVFAAFADAELDVFVDVFAGIFAGDFPGDFEVDLDTDFAAFADDFGAAFADLTPDFMPVLADVLAEDFAEALTAVLAAALVALPAFLVEACEDFFIDTFFTSAMAHSPEKQLGIGRNIRPGRVSVTLFVYGCVYRVSRMCVGKCFPQSG